MNTFVERHPFGFALLIVLAQLGIAAGCRLLLGLADTQASLERLAIIIDLLLAFLAGVLLTRLGWWQAAGFNGPRRWRDLYVLWFPALVTALPFLGGLNFPPAGTWAGLLAGTLIGVAQEEAIFRGLLWRALLPKGARVATATTAALFGAVHIGIVVLGGPLAVAVPAMIATTCAGVLYAAVRYRTNSIWLVLLLHAAFNLVNDVATAETLPWLIGVMNVAITLGFVAYGLYLLRRHTSPGTARHTLVTAGLE